VGGGSGWVPDARGLRELVPEALVSEAPVSEIPAFNAVSVDPVSAEAMSPEAMSISAVSIEAAALEAARLDVEARVSVADEAVARRAAASAITVAETAIGGSARVDRGSYQGRRSRRRPASDPRSRSNSTAPTTASRKGPSCQPKRA
jgi:hypothetical protein